MEEKEDGVLTCSRYVNELCFEKEREREKDVTFLSRNENQ